MKKMISSLVVLTTVSFSAAFADQPHMHSALGQLRAARAELEHATADKAGHRQRAIELVDKAIAEVAAGETAARANR